MQALRSFRRPYTLSASHRVSAFRALSQLPVTDLCNLHSGNCLFPDRSEYRGDFCSVPAWSDGQQFQRAIPALISSFPSLPLQCFHTPPPRWSSPLSTKSRFAMFFSIQQTHPGGLAEPGHDTAQLQLLASFAVFSPLMPGVPTQYQNCHLQALCRVSVVLHHIGATRTGA